MYIPIPVILILIILISERGQISDLPWFVVGIFALPLLLDLLLVLVGITVNFYMQILMFISYILAGVFVVFFVYGIYKKHKQGTLKKEILSTIKNTFNLKKSCKETSKIGILIILAIFFVMILGMIFI